MHEKLIVVSNNFSTQCQLSHVEPEDIWPHPPVRAKATDGVLTDLSPTKAKAKAAEEKFFSSNASWLSPGRSTRSSN
jgi:hypothetical protein